MKAPRKITHSTGARTRAPRYDGRQQIGGLLRFGGRLSLEVYLLRRRNWGARVVGSDDLPSTRLRRRSLHATKKSALHAFLSKTWHCATGRRAILSGCTVAARQWRHARSRPKPKHGGNHRDRNSRNSQKRMQSRRTTARKGAKSRSTQRCSKQSRFAGRCVSARSYSYDDSTLPLGRLPGQPLVFVVVLPYHHFPGEGAVDKGEVAGGQEDADGPPHQANLQAVGSSFCASKRPRILLVAERQHHGL